jgi:hypothetical protein
MLVVVCQVQRVMPRVWGSFHTRLVCTRAACTVLVPWQGLQPCASGFVPLSMADYCW